YLNSSDSPIYKKGEHLFGLNVARRAISVSRTALITEGYMDVLTLHQYGYDNACGVLGTALTPDQIRRLSGFCSLVECIFDGDRAGRQAALRSSEMLMSAGLKCRVLILPDGEDVDSLLQQQGTEAFEAVRNAAPDGLEYCMDTIRRDRSPKEIVQWAIQFVNNLSDPELAAFYAPRIMNGLGLSEEALRPALASHSEKRGGKKTSLPNGVPAHTSGQAMRERQLLRFALCFPQYVPLLCERGADRAFATSRGRSLWEKLIDFGPEGVSAYLDEGEKRFFTECRMEREHLAADEQSLLDEVLESLKTMAEQAKRREIQERLREHAGHGAHDPMEDLRALQQTLGTGRNDGQ
ncbi:MAG: toprim domain-containing protein, partial [Oceanidesulfovibrio sp.]